jgi:hypothetical protein
LTLLLALLGPGACQTDKVRPMGLEVHDVPDFAFSPDLVVLATGGTNGMLELCNCPSSLTGGLARRSGLVQSYRTSFENVAVVDVGNAMHYDPDEPRNRYLPRGYRMIGYDVLVPGNHEWALGPEKLGDRFTLDQPVLLASDVAVDGRPADLRLRDDLRVGRGDVSGVQIISALGPEALLFIPAHLRKRIHPPSLDQLAARAERFKDSDQAVIVLVHGSGRFAGEVARQLGPSLIIRGRADQPGASVAYVGSVPVITVGGNQAVSAIALRLGSNGRLDLDLRLELVDKRWPVDPRLLNLYREFVADVSE